MGKPSWKGQISYALNTIDCRGQSKHQAKIEQGWKPHQPVFGIYSDGEFNTVFRKSLTVAHWLTLHYPQLHFFRDVEAPLLAEFLAEKSETCKASYVGALLSALRKLQEGLVTLGWIDKKIISDEWRVSDHAEIHVPRGAYTPEESQAIMERVTESHTQYGQALRFILSTGARIDEVFHLRADKVFVAEGRVELLGKGGKTRRIKALNPGVLSELNLSRRFVYLERGNEHLWKPGLENAVREACNELGIERRGVHGLRGSAACELVRIKTNVLGLTESQARRELAMWLGHNPHRTEVTYAYVPRALVYNSESMSSGSNAPAKQ